MSRLNLFYIQWSGQIYSIKCFFILIHPRPQVHLPPSVAASGVPVLVYGTAHNVELLLEAEVPLVYSAFKMSGYTPGQIVQHWLTQCFWNFLDWEQITLYLTLCILLGPDYQVTQQFQVLSLVQCNLSNEAVLGQAVSGLIREVAAYIKPYV